MKIFYFKITKASLLTVLLITLLFLSFHDVISQTISGKIFGQSSWMPYSIGTTVYNGKLDSQWNKVKDSQAKIIRYGGIAVDKNMPTHNQYLNMIDSIRNNGMEPVMLVSFYNNKYTEVQAASTVEFINITNTKNVKYWVIGNEPDNEYGYVNSAQVAAYIKKFSSAMKKKDPSIKIIAPETAWYNQNILDGLTTPGGVSDITGKDSSGNFIADIISFHIFPFRGIQKRSEAISYLSGPDHFEDDLSQLNQKIAACNSFHQRNSISPLKIAVTEANINWKNPQGDGVFGVGANSFLGGQFWAEMIGICMKKNVEFINFWSVIEGNELGYLNNSTTSPKPSYYHFQMLADNFKGYYCKGTDNNTNIKSFGSKNNDQISVLILNQDQSNDFIYKLRLDTNLISGTDPLKINIDAGTNIEYNDTSFRESSIVLIFNTNGALINKCVYKLYGNADQSLPPICNTKASPLTASITFPANNASFNADSDITIQATASGGTGSIQKVEFFADTTKLGEDFLAPFSFIWSNAAVGNYALTAKATDSIGNTSVSEVINISVNPINQLTVSITSPANNSSFNEGSAISIQATASGGTGSIQKVEFFADTTKLGEDFLAPFSFIWSNAAVGNYALTAKATDSIGNTSVSEVINISVNPINQLTVSITSPANNSSFNEGSAISIQATASGGTGSIQKVEFFADTTKLGEDFLAPFSFTWSNAAVGNYALTAKATDSIGNTSVSEVINISVNPINQLTVSITSPANNSSFNEGSDISIQATASGGTGSIQKVEFFADTTKLGEDFLAPFSFTWSNAAVGNYALTAKATDSIGNTSVSEVINISVNPINQLTVSITSPANNSFFNVDSTITILAAASGGTGSIQKVEFFADTTKLGEDFLAPYSFTWSNAAVGNYALTAKATDSTGNTSVSEVINISVNPINQLTVSITSPANNSFFNVDSTITILAAASGGTGSIQKVEFFADTTKLGEDFLAPFSFIWSNAAVGNYALTAKATDSIGNTSVSEVINISVNPINQLTVSITSPANNSSFNEGSAISIQATASGGTGSIQKVEFFADTTKLGEDFLAPFSFTWSNAAVGNYAHTAKATDSTGNTSVSGIINITINPTVKKCSATGTIAREVWSNISGTSVSTIPLSVAPNLTGQLTVFQAPSNVANNYGQRIRGYVCPPVTGNYIFWIASDDNSELWLSSNNDSANKQKIASVSGKTGPSQWTKYSSQKSASIYLTSDQQYYIEALHKENTQKDNLAVGWQLPDSVLERPIPGNRLSPFGAIALPPSIELVSAGSSWKYPVNGTNSINTIVTDDSLHKNTTLENSYDMIVYPNPTTGQFNLEFCLDGLQEKTIVIEVSNSFGKVIYKKLPQTINGCIKETIDLEPELPIGVYLMKVTIGDKIQTAKLLLTR